VRTPAAGTGQRIRKLKVELFLASALMLFSEVALIRWLGENVFYLSFFTNFILLASFLGIGIGFLRAEQDLRWFLWAGHLLLLLLAFVTVFPIGIDRTAEEVLFQGSGAPRGLPIWIALPIIFVMSVTVMAALGHGVARLFAQLEALTAYRMDILGSIAGVAGFAIMAYLQTPPLVWGLIIVILYLYLLSRRRQGTHLLVSVGIVVILAIQSFNPFYEWSPYYQVITADLGDTISISVNQIPFQAMASVEYLDEIGWVASRTFDMLKIQDPEDVLIIGAGSGNDVALALRAGAKNVDAVEIDPVIYRQGLDLHPDQPYQQTSRVTVHIDDGRAFIERSQRQYDFILFALTDSLTVVSGQSNLRLESFLFTTESVEAAKLLLADDGILAFYNLHTDQWVIDRMGRTLQTVFDQAPCYRSEPGIRGTTLAVGNVSAICAEGMLRDFSDGPTPATDDLPFLYIRDRGIPLFYLVTIAAILIASLAALRIGVRRISSIRPYSDLFFMGAAFLLLTTKGIVQFALWFGTTWVVNALVFMSVLASVLLAIEVVQRFRMPSFAVLYGVLALSLFVVWTVPPHWLLAMPMGPRVVAAAVITFTPVFVANVIFAERFKDTSSSTAAFGANLLGAMVGGLLEYTSLMVGYRNLSVLVAILYLMAFVLLRRSARSEKATLTPTLNLAHP